MKRITTGISWPKLPSLAVALLLLPVVSVIGIETDLREMSGQSLFSPNFFTELDEANRASDAARQLEALYEKFNKPPEQSYD